MGYTHYWDYKPQPGDTLKFKDVLREVLILKKENARKQRNSWR